MAEPPHRREVPRDAGPSGTLSSIDSTLDSSEIESGSALRVGSNFHTHDKL